jgi:hypothetical protein
MVKALNTTHGSTFEANTFEEAFSWGVSNLPGPAIPLSECSSYKAEFEENGRTAFDDRQERCYAETIEIWDTTKLGDDYPGEED